MANGSVLTKLGRNIAIYRTYTANGSLSSTQYLPPTKFKAGVLNATPTVADTDLTYPIPVEDGTTNDDGSNTLTGSSGGDNSTDNTTTFKEGGGNVDVTAQNLIANNGNATKIWTIANLASAGTNVDGTEPFGLWLYILDATALAKFKSSGTALEIKLGSDTSNYYSKTFTASQLAVGWNWITSNTTAVNALTETGTVSGNIDTFVIEITTNNATDTFIAGDVIYDLLRQWSSSDLLLSFSSGYPSFDYTNNEVTLRGYLSSTKANGFLVNGAGVFNEDTTPLMNNNATFTGESKSSTDEFIFVVKNRLRDQ